MNARDEAVLCAAEVLGVPVPGTSLYPHLHARRQAPPPAAASLMPHLHAKPQDAPPAGTSLLTPAQRATRPSDGDVVPLLEDAAAAGAASVPDALPEGVSLLTPREQAEMRERRGE